MVVGWLTGLSERNSLLDSFLRSGPGVASPAVFVAFMFVCWAGGASQLTPTGGSRSLSGSMPPILAPVSRCFDRCLVGRSVSLLTGVG